LTITTDKIKSLFRFSNSDRSGKAKKNIILLLLIHGINFFALMLIVPLTLGYLGPEEYGIWITLSSILTWVTYLDLGIGNGLRVKLAEAFAVSDFNKGKIYVSTSYALFSGGMLSLFLLFLAVNPFLDWTFLLNTGSGLRNELGTLVIWVFGLFLLQFVLKLLTYIISADQRTSITGALNLTVNLLTVLFLFILTKSVGRGSLHDVGIGVSIMPVIVYLVAGYAFFKTIFKKVSPSFKFIDFKYSRDLLVLGGQFFIIQAAGLIVFSTDNIIISQLFNPAEVTVYNIAYRYFYFVPMLFGIFLNPLLPAYTEAYAKNDVDWIKKTTGKTLKIWLLLAAGVIIMLLVSGIVYSVWVGKSVNIPFGLSAAMALFVIVNNWNNIFAYFLNGIGKIRLQFYLSIFSAIINIPVSVFFAKYLNMGAAGVITGTIFCLLISGSFWAPLQYKKIISGKASGIWNK
jgi:O-antigen/teichoic acid export membrane protein